LKLNDDDDELMMMMMMILLMQQQSADKSGRVTFSLSAILVTNVLYYSRL